MTMPKDEQAIIAGFRTMEKAEEASSELKQLGVLDLRIDRLSYYPTPNTNYALDTQNERVHNPITGDFPGLANAVFEQSMDRDASVLASAHPSASGMADGQGEDVGVDIILTVVVAREQFHQAEQIVRGHGVYFNRGKLHRYITLT